MKTTAVILAVIFVLGGALLGMGMVMTKGDLSGIVNDARVKQNVDESGEVHSLLLDIFSDDVEIYASPDGFLHMEYWDSESSPIEYTFTDGRASLVQKNSLKRIFSFGVNNRKTVIVYLPASVNKDITFKVSSGKITDAGCGINAESLKIQIASGDAVFKDITAGNAEITSSSGRAEFDGLIAGSLKADLSSGSIKFNRCTIDKAELKLASGNADISDSEIGELKSDISSGSLTAGLTGVRSVNAKTSSGNIRLQLSGAAVSEYSLNVRLTSGELNIKGIEGGDINVRSDFSFGSGARTVDCTAVSGSVTIAFD